MSFYGFLRLGAAPLAISGWIVYQLLFKKKKFQEIKQDFCATLFMVGIYVLLIYWITF
jgi:hypothetical protein